MTQNQHFKVKILKNNEGKWIYFNIIKAVHNEPKAQITLNVGKTPIIVIKINILLGFKPIIFVLCSRGMYLQQGFYYNTQNRLLLLC